MRKVTMFNFLSLDGYYKDVNNTISWHQHGQEEGEFSAEGAGSGNILLFGRVTYQMMASFWPTQQAIQTMPAVANGMNATEKMVFSNTLQTADWHNTQIISGDIIEAVKKLKQTPGKNMTILGSGSIVSQFAEAGLIDEYQLMIDPVAIGDGVSIFKGLSKPLNLELVATRTFKSGVILLNYKLM